MERLWEVVVGAELEPSDAVLGGAGGREHQDHRRVFAGGDELAELIAVDAGEVAVEDDDLVWVDVELRRGFVAVVGDIRGDPLVAEPFGNPVCVAGHVLDDQDPHLTAVASCAIDADGSVICTRRPPSGRD